jgi:hypothetical protein
VSGPINSIASAVVGSELVGFRLLTQKRATGLDVIAHTVTESLAHIERIVGKQAS